MLTLKQFKKFIGVIEFVDERISKEAQLFDELLEDSYGIPKGLAHTQDKLVEALAYAMNCSSELIYWYCYDCSFGNVPLTYEVDGKEEVMDSVEKLYELIVKESDAKD